MVFHSIELRIQALSLAAWGIPTKEIAAYLGLSQRTIQDIYKI
jgi:DNA-binding CsgD family transcriptional regulator